MKRGRAPTGDNGGSGEGIISCSYHGVKSNGAPVWMDVEKCKLVEVNDRENLNVGECAIGHLVLGLLGVGWLVALSERSHTAEFHYHAAVEQSRTVAL